MLRDYMQLFALAGAVALECGGCAGHLHVQGVLRVHIIADDNGKKALQTHIKNFILVQRGLRIGSSECL